MLHKIRSFAFSLLFVLWTTSLGILLIWTLFLPLDWFRWMSPLYLNGVLWLERTILGLHYEVRGWENLPKSGSYIIASKHQSAFETLRITVMFPGAATVLKKELVQIPLWGPFLEKMARIPVDRKGDGAKSLKFMIAAMEPIVARGEPIMIYPQGTRVPVGGTAADYPYKPGVALVAKAHNLPIIPMRCDSGLYWPKHGWTNKKSGTVKFEILPPLTGTTTKEIMAQLEEALEVPPQF